MSGIVRQRRAASAAALAFAAFVAACGPTEEELDTNPTDVGAEVSERVTTVATVHWKTEKPSIGYVEWGLTPDLEMPPPPMGTEEATSHEQILVGLEADTVYYYRVVTWDDDAGRSETKSFRTGYLPPGLPQLELEGTGHDEYVIVPLLGAERYVIIINPQGKIVWYYEDEETEYDHYRARLARDGTGVLYSATEMTPDPVEDSEVVKVSWDGSERTSIPIPKLAHDFVEHADGTIGALVLEDRDVDGMNIRSNRIIEVDPDDGNEREIWTPYNCFDPVEDPGDEPDISQNLGWTFTNALDFVASGGSDGTGVYYVSVRNLSTLARVDRATGVCDWTLGSAPSSTLEFDSAADIFLHEHQFKIFAKDCPTGAEFSECRVLVMDNEGSLRPQESRVLEYSIDFETGVATQVWSYMSDPPAYTWVLGEVERYPNGDTFINWSTAGSMERVSATGEVTWKLRANLGAAFGFNSLAKSLQAP
jgi:hypothetical protein